MVCSVSSSDAGIKLRWAGLTLSTPLVLFAPIYFVRVEGAKFEFLALHVYHIMVHRLYTDHGVSDGVLGVFIRCSHQVEMGWFDTFNIFSHLLRERRRGET
jgi:hypothetical protein